jgi:hypothetical protein
MDEAVEWLKRAPFQGPTPRGEEVEVEIRPVFEPEDFGPDIRQHEERLQQLRTQAGGNK